MAPTTWTKYTYLNALIALVGGLERDRPYSFAEIAHLLGCSEAQAHKVVEQLCEVTIPNLAGLGESIVPLTIDDAGVTLHDALSFSTAHTLRLDRMQTIAAVLALRMRGIAWDDALMQALCDAVTTDAPIEHLSHIIDISPVSFQAAVLETLAQAALDGCCVEVVYQGTARTVEPWLLLDERDQHYVYAWCRLRDEPRMFRLDHLSEARLLKGERATHAFEEYASRGGRDDVAAGREGASESGAGASADASASNKRIQAYPGLERAPHTARLYFADPVTYNGRAWPGARVIATTKPGVTIELPYTEPSWIARQVVAHLGDVTVVGPEPMREAVIEHATRIRALCGADR